MKALILVDIQTDFCPDGALPVAKGDEVVPVANRLITSCKFDLIIATQDHHPATHKSFASNHESKKVGDVIDLNSIQQMLWPNHCIWGTKGADFHRNLLVGRVNLILRKGTNPEVDSYSAFYDNAKKPTGLHGYLKSNGVKDVYIAGLATDYCVKFTAMDAQTMGLEFESVHLIEDGCRAVNICKSDGAMAIKQMKDAGIVIDTSDDLLKSFNKE